MEALRSLSFPWRSVGTSRCLRPPFRVHTSKMSLRSDETYWGSTGRRGYVKSKEYDSVYVQTTRTLRGHKTPCLWIRDSVSLLSPSGPGCSPRGTRGRRRVPDGRVDLGPFSPVHRSCFGLGKRGSRVHTSPLSLPTERRGGSIVVVDVSLVSSSP